MKICLVSAPARRGRGIPSASWPPVGILTLAAVIERIGLQPLVIDLEALHSLFLAQAPTNSSPTGFPGFAASLLASSFADVYGFGTTAETYSVTLQLARLLKNKFPAATVILGGTQASGSDVPTLEAFPFIDLIVRGEAEDRLPAVMRALSDGHGLANILGVTFRSGHQVVQTPDAPGVPDVATLPLPAYHLCSNLSPNGVLGVELSRHPLPVARDGSPASRRLKPPSLLAKQMRELQHSYGMDSFALLSDPLSLTRDDIVEYATAILHSGYLPLSWSSCFRVECLDDDVLGLLAAAGCVELILAPDPCQSDAVSHAITVTRSASALGINVVPELSLPLEAATPEDLRLAIRAFIDLLRCDRANPLITFQHDTAPSFPATGKEVFGEDSDTLPGVDAAQPHDHQGILRYAETFRDCYSLQARLHRSRYVRQLREFLLDTSNSCRFLLVAAVTVTNDSLSLFDEWISSMSLGDTTAIADDTEATRKCRTRFLRFLRMHYEDHPDGYSHIIRALVDLETMLDAYSPSPPRLPHIAPPRTALSLDDICLPHLGHSLVTIQLPADPSRILQCLRGALPLSSIARRQVHVALSVTPSSEVAITQLSDAAARVLTHVDGRRTAREIVDLCEDIPSPLARDSLNTLLERNLICIGDGCAS